MLFHVYRPDAQKPEELHVGMDQKMFDFVLSHLNKQYDSLDQRIGAHNSCDRLESHGCVVSGGYCYDDLAVVHEQQMELIQVLKDARIVRENPEVKDAATFRRLQEEARAVRETALRTLEPTSTYNVVAKGTDDEQTPDRREVDPNEVTRIQTQLQQELGTSEPS